MTGRLRHIGGAACSAAMWLLFGLAGASCGGNAAPNPETSGDGGASQPVASAPPAEPSATAGTIDLSRLRADGPRFVGAEGTTFQWRGVSAFRLLEMIARGREAEAVAFLDWAAQERLTVVRVLTMAHNLFALAPDEGREALPRLLELAADRRLYVEIVALADTNHIAADLQQHVAEIGRIAASHPNALVEIANEPVHPTQDARVHDPAFLRSLAAVVPDEVPAAYGSADDSDAHAGGDYVTVHTPRRTEDGGWAHVFALTQVAPLVPRWKKPVVSDEPIGAAAEYQPGRRDNDPARFRGAALLTRLAGLGATFHYEGGLYARVPDGRELECFQAWNEAWALLPPDIEQRGAFGTGADGILTVGVGTRHVVHRRTDNEAWVLLIGPDAEPAISAAAEWTVAGVQSLPGVTLVHARREAP